MYNYNPYYGVPQMQTPQFTQTPSLSGEMVSDYETVKAVRPDMTGRTAYYPMTDGKSIYAKRLNADGMPQIFKFELVSADEEKVAVNRLQDLTDTIATLTDKVDTISAMLFGGKEDE